MADQIETDLAPTPTIPPAPGALAVIPPTPNLPAVIPAKVPEPRKRRWLRTVPLLAGILILGGGAGYWWLHRLPGLPAGIAFGNGRLEADEIDIDTKFAGRIATLSVDEGDVVEASQTVALMDSQDLEASLGKSQAQVLQAQQTVRQSMATLAQRIMLDAYPGHPIPAAVTFVAAQAQFTPKTVETKDERDSLMFRVRVRIDPARLQIRTTPVKSGLPGIAYVRTDPNAIWPATLQPAEPK